MAMEEPQAYTMVDNPSYAVPKQKVETTLEAYYSIPMDAGPNSSSGKTPSETNKLAMAALILVFFVAALALSSTIIALVSYFNTKSQLSQDTHFCQDTMQAQITKLTLDLNSTQSELKVMLRRINETKDVAAAGKNSYAWLKL